jgi:hypothetical protein
VAAAFNSYHAVDLTQLNPTLTGSVSTAWGGTAGVEVLPETRLGTVLLRGPTTLQLSATTLHPIGPLAENAQVGQINAVLNGAKVSWRVIVTNAIAAPPWWWKLLNG